MQFSPKFIGPMLADRYIMLLMSEPVGGELRPTDRDDHMDLNVRTLRVAEAAMVRSVSRIDTGMLCARPVGPVAVKSKIHQCQTSAVKLPRK